MLASMMKEESKNEKKVLNFPNQKILSQSITKAVAHLWVKYSLSDVGGDKVND